MIQLAGQFVPLKLNGEKEGAEFVKQYRVEGYPTILFLEPGGTVAGRIVGYKGPADMGADLKRLSAEQAALPALRARVKANPRDPASQARLAVILAGRDDRAGAYAALTQAAKLDPSNKTGTLAAAYNALGDAYQSASQFAKAIPLFQRGAKLAKTPRDLSYARISIAVCYLSSNQAAKAVPELKAVSRMSGAPKEYRDSATQYLKMLEQRGIR